MQGFTFRADRNLRFHFGFYLNSIVSEYSQTKMKNND